MGVSGLTALKALDIAGVEAGQSVLVVGASGGVGTYAIQIAVALGAKVTGVASVSKATLRSPRRERSSSSAARVAVPGVRAWAASSRPPC